MEPSIRAPVWMDALHQVQAVHRLYIIITFIITSSNNNTITIIGTLRQTIKRTSRFCRNRMPSIR